MRVAVIGDTQHYRDEAGRLCALEPVVNQLDRWANLFDEIVLCAPLDPGPPPTGFAPYQSANIRIEPLKRAGGNNLMAKVRLATHIVGWAYHTRRVARQVDAVHLRCPCNIGLIAIVSTMGAVKYRYAMFAGVWHDYEGEPRFYRLQRKLLGSRRFGGPVSVYADRQLDQGHLEPFFSPSYSRSDWEKAGPAAEAKVARLRDPAVTGPWRLVTVGRLTENKNQQTIIRAMPLIVERGMDVTLDVYGDGPSRGALEALARELGVEDRVTLRGSVDHGEVMAAFVDADLNLLATRQEGYGKVLLEGMVHATVPVFSESPVAGEVSGHGTRGLVFPTDDHATLAAHVAGLIDDRERWAATATEARRYAGTMTLDDFEDRVREMLERQWGVELRPPLPVEDAT